MKVPINGMEAGNQDAPGKVVRAKSYNCVIACENNLWWKEPNMLQQSHLQCSQVKIVC